MTEQDQSSLEGLFELSDTAPSVDRRDDAEFQHEIQRLIEKAEEFRLRYMRQHQLYQMIGTTAGMIILLAGSSGFAWFLLMNTDLPKAIACLVLGIVIPLFLYWWIQTPVKHYKEDYKSDYLPELAQLLGGFSYHRDKGISEKVLRRTGVTPAFVDYKAEDCFRGLYNGTKVLFSEACLKDKKKKTVFHGLFVLLEIPHSVFEGHTIITADRTMADTYALKRWAKLQKIKLNIAHPALNRFVAYSDKPDENTLILGDKFIKELAEADMAFGNAKLSAVLFQGKYVFLMIPHDKDMFEASELYLPISTQKHALACKKEIEQLLEIVDVFDLYAAKS